MRLNLTANSFVFGHINCEIPPTTFSVNHAGGELPKCVWTYSKQLRFWTHKSWNCAKNFFCKTCRQRTSKIRPNFTANSFFFGHI